MIADKGYDSDALVRAIKRQGTEAVIPSKKNRKEASAYDEHLYNERNKVERFINLIKQCRRVATRYEKTARNFLGFVHVAAIMVLLREPSSRMLPRICPHGPRVYPRILGVGWGRTGLRPSEILGVRRIDAAL